MRVMLINMRGITLSQENKLTARVTFDGGVHITLEAASISDAATIIFHNIAGEAPAALIRIIEAMVPDLHVVYMIEEFVVGRPVWHRYVVGEEIS